VAGYRELLPDAPVSDVYLALMGDTVFAEHSCRLAEHHACGAGRAYLSRFDRRRSTRHVRVRAWHCADIPFAFGTLGVVELAFLIGGPPTEEDRALSRRMVRAWADFAATGDPGWPALTIDTTPVRTWATTEDRFTPEDTSRARPLWRRCVPAAAPR